MSKIRVLKFGGSSVGSTERLSKVLEIIVTEQRRSPLAVVVSAMGKTTDWLIASAASCSPRAAVWPASISQ
ncbi:MAG: aspartate kinase, partial [Myxococcota bacterium]